MMVMLGPKLPTQRDRGGGGGFSSTSRRRPARGGGGSSSSSSSSDGDGSSSSDSEIEQLADDLKTGVSIERRKKKKSSHRRRNAAPPTDVDKLAHSMRQMESPGSQRCGVLGVLFAGLDVFGREWVKQEATQAQILVEHNALSQTWEWLKDGKSDECTCQIDVHCDGNVIFRYPRAPRVVGGGWVIRVIANEDGARRAVDAAKAVLAPLLSSSSRFAPYSRG
jgi:hypothetical protein